MKFCDYYSFEYAAQKDRAEVPLLKIETDGTRQSEGQLATRIQAFGETGLGLVSEEKNIPQNGGGYTAGIDAALDCRGDPGAGRNHCRLVGDPPTGAGAARGAEKAFQEALDRAGVSREKIAGIVSTGYGRENIGLGDETVTEITCHAKGAWFLRPGVRTVIDIGGQDSKVICLDSRGNVENFVMNDKCAAGTGRFLEMMARTMELSLEELSRRGLEWKEDINISSMCTVFAESEVVSLIARNTAVPDIIHGLNKAVAAKTAALARRLKARGPYMMTGGVARNAGVVRELEKRLGEKIYISEYAQLCGAVGAARTAFAKTAEINRRTNMRNDKVYYGIRIIAGIYVIYIACRYLSEGCRGRNREKRGSAYRGIYSHPGSGHSLCDLGNCKSEKNFQFSRKGIRPGGDGGSGRISGSGG